MERASALVVDADDAWRSKTASLLVRVGLEVATASTAASAVELAQRERPSLVILDVELPDLDGYQVCRELRERHGDDLPIILVSSDRTEPHDRIAALLIGADECLAKPCDPGELLARVRRHLARVNGRPRRDDANGTEDATRLFGLTRREHDVLQLLASGLGQGEIAGQLVISPRTVSSHIQRILAKLGVHSRAQAVALAHREGLVADPLLTASVFS